MECVFKNSSWIWAKDSLNEDDYAEFLVPFTSDLEELNLRISCDTVYSIYLNNELIKFMGCFDYENYKLFDEIKINPKKGENLLKIDVWHYGVGSLTYKIAQHGLIFELINDNGDLLATSGKSTKSRVMNEFKNGYKKSITWQQGVSFYFDSRVNQIAFSDSILVDKKTNFVKREINDLVLLDRQKISFIEREHSIIIDLGKETSGIVDIELESPKDQLLTIAYGEHIKDGYVRRIIEYRDFSVEYFAHKGINKFLNPLKRIAGRYLEVFYEEKPTIKYLGIRPVFYKHEEVRKDYKDELINKINSVSIDTLNLCMHEHYEDCPWREQALYILDSANQMLCGYYAFKGFEYQRHNLLLISKSLTKYDMFSITAPMEGDNIIIPLFNLLYLKALKEYVEHTNDYSILDEVKEPVETVINCFQTKINDNGLIPYFHAPYWNFYDWTDESDNEFNLDADRKDPENQYDSIINCAYVYSINIYNELFKKQIDTTKTINAIKNTFYDKERNVYVLNTNTKSYSQLCNSFACLIGLGNDGIREKIKHDKNMIEASFSNLIFVYDALLTDPKEKDFVINDIKVKYKAMLDDGATSFYEVEGGADAFPSGAGSMCHGWSAIPIYYFAKLLQGRK